MATPSKASFASAVVKWQRAHGRHQLPWQNQSPYHVWLSEIMLQQTQVATAIPYYLRFIQQWPTVQALAQAAPEDVMHAWSGLGYYRRASLLHRAAQMVCTQYAGIFPCTAHALQNLPGIGKSTAAAIAAFCYHERTPIMDANVRRVLARAYAVQDEGPAQQHLWTLANQLLPHRASDMPAYTQGLMDLGSQICKTKKPLCTQCPVAHHCQAYATDTVASYPIARQAIKRKTVHWWWLWLQDVQQRILLVQRPSTGIWANLYCLPTFTQEEDIQNQLQHYQVQSVEILEPISHALTHRDLVIQTLRATTLLHDPSASSSWMHPTDIQKRGLPAPLKKLLFP